MNNAYLLTGGNLGNRLHNVTLAGQLIQQYCGNIIKQSSVYQTAAWGFKEQPDFYNQALCITTALSPEQLMTELLAIENKMERVRDIKMGPRTIDLDILLYNDLIINTAQLILPHPRMQERRFVLLPLAEIAAEVIHPVLQKTIAELLANCKDSLDVYKIETV